MLIDVSVVLTDLEGNDHVETFHVQDGTYLPTPPEVLGVTFHLVDTFVGDWHVVGGTKHEVTYWYKQQEQELSLCGID